VYLERLEGETIHSQPWRSHPAESDAEEFATGISQSLVTRCNHEGVLQVSPQTGRYCISRARALVKDQGEEKEGPPPARRE